MFCRVSINPQREAADQIGFLGWCCVQAPQQSHSLLPNARRGLQVGISSQQRSDVICKKSRMQQKECEDTWGDFEVTAKQPLLYSPNPSGVERGKRSPTFSQGPSGAEIGLTRETILHVQQPRFHWPPTSQRPSQPARRG